MNPLLLNDTHIEELSIAHHKYMCSFTKSRYHLWEVYQGMVSLTDSSSFSGQDIPEGVTSTLEKEFDQSTYLGVCYLIPMGLFHDNQVLWQGLKVRMGQWCRSMRHYSPRHLHFVYVIDIYILQYHDDNSRHLPSYFRLLSYEFST